MSLHVLVLGGTGFIGAAVVAALRADPDIRVSLLVNRRPPPDCSGLRMVRGNLLDADWPVVLADPPDVVIHLARMAGRNTWRRWLAGARGFQANRRLIKFLRALPRPPRVVYVSGSLMYGSRGEEWVDESFPLRPTSFARQYLWGEQPFLRAQARNELPVCMVRPPWILGAGSWFAEFYARPLLGSGFAPCYGPGDNWMNLLHLDDCGALIRHIARDGSPGANYNLAGPALRQGEFSRILASLTGAEVRQLPLSVLARRLDTSLVEAFSSSIRLCSLHQEFLDRCPLRFSDPVMAIKDTLSRFKDIQGVLAKTP